VPGNLTESPPATSTAPPSLTLTLAVSDPDVVAELVKHPEGPAREQYALTALRLGVLALRQARGELDAAAIREAGQQILHELERALLQHREQITNALRQYFDPSSGELPRRLESLLKQDGELERFLRQHLGPQGSMLAETLEQQLQPLLALLDPDEAQGLRARIEKSVWDALEEQRKHILAEFTLDNEQSALSRLVRNVTDANGKLAEDIENLVKALADEFSLDKPDSALCRLVKKIEEAQGSIDRSLTLDDEASPLSRLKREFQATLDELVKSNAEFQADVRARLTELTVQRRMEARTTLGGLSFQEKLRELLEAEARRLNDLFQDTSATPGALSRCKTGDFVIRLGDDTAAPGARIVWEAKNAAGYNRQKALEELEEARKNREAQIGVFVFSKEAAPNGLDPFERQGRDLVVIWDPDDPTTDVIVKAAYSVARALIVRESRESGEAETSLRAIEEAVQAIQTQVNGLEQIKSWAETVKSNGEKIAERAKSLKATIEEQIAALNRHIDILRAKAVQL